MKKWYRSKMLWTNVAAFAVAILEGQYGVTGLDTDTVLGLVALINIGLRLATFKGLE